MPSPPNLLLDMFGLGSPMPSPPNSFYEISKHRLHAISFPSILSPIPSPTDHQSKGFSNTPSTSGVPLNEFGDLFPTLPTKSLATLSEDSKDSASPIICINVPAVPSDEAVLPPCAKPLPKAEIRARCDQLLDVLHLLEADKERAKDLWDKDPDSEIRESFNIIDEFRSLSDGIDLNEYYVGLQIFSRSMIGQPIVPIHPYHDSHIVTTYCQYQACLEKLGLDPKVETEGFPSLFYTPELSVTTTDHKTMDVPNPLSFFKFDRIPGNFKDTTRALTTNTSVWPHTADSPTPGESDIDDHQKTLKQQAEDLRMKVGMLFSFHQQVDNFSELTYCVWNVCNQTFQTLK
ncbi:hypothetical protein PAXINDRAFT_14953 [Paxillus involutus ATCC 200175]|uniref:Uncharacterized protein n=1 Tax=Paxillus involutus ATCC 200175 TaxID=664439 RepID=A0A0C9TY57_PAXIN|nr:hypothetical protein PAXINDRAFT_14953 [Paxillus involutus ATCC 200175]